jgi:hypothetical protein
MLVVRYLLVGSHKILPYGVLTLPPSLPSSTQNATSWMPGPRFFNASRSLSSFGTLKMNRGFLCSDWLAWVGVLRSHTVSVVVAMVGFAPIIEVNWFDIVMKSLLSTKVRTCATPLAVDGCCVFGGGSTGTWAMNQVNQPQFTALLLTNPPFSWSNIAAKKGHNSSAMAHRRSRNDPLEYLPIRYRPTPLLLR